MVSTLGYFGVLLHRLLLGTTFGYYHQPSILPASVFAQNFYFEDLGNLHVILYLVFPERGKKNGLKNI